MNRPSLNFFSLATGLLISVASLDANAQTISGSVLGSVSQLPGSASDYVLFNSSSPTVTTLSDFSVTTHGNPLYEYSDPTGNPTNTSLLTPGGTSVSTGAVWQYSTPQVFSFTLGTSATFDYSNFNVYVLYGNVNYNDSAAAKNNFNTSFSFADASIGLGAGPNDGGGTFVTVSDTNTSPTMGDIVEFNIQNATAGETFTLGAVSATGNDEIEFGGISFGSADAPEPSVRVMMLTGLVLLIGLRRFTRLT